MDLMKASIAHHIRPTALILGKDSGKPWDEWDTAFAKAYQRFLSEICQQCGAPIYICHNDDNRIEIKPKRDECESAKVAEREQARLSADKNLKLYGVRIKGEPSLSAEALAEGLEFVDFRRPYYIEQAKKRGLIPDEEELALSE